MIYLSPHKITNFLNQDKILDWLPLYGALNGYLPDKTNPYHNKWNEWICQRGNQWETNQIKELEQIAQENNLKIHQISQNKPETPEEWERVSHQSIETLRSQEYDILLQVPIQAELQPGVIWRGIVDVLILSRCFDKIGGISMKQTKKHHKYFIADWKQNRVHLTREKVLSFQTYKHWYYQCFIYQQILLTHQIPIYDDKFGIIPSKVRFLSQSIPGGIQEEIVVSYFRWTEQKEVLEQAAEWHLKLQEEETKSWNPIQHPDLAPNCRNQSSSNYSQAKLLIARMRSELTLIPYVSPKRKHQAEEALKHNGTLRADNNLVAPSHLGFRCEGLRAKRVRRSLECLRELSSFQEQCDSSWNRETQRCLSNYPNWLQETSHNYIAIDFEFMPVAWLQSPGFTRETGHVLVCWGYISWNDAKPEYHQYVIEEPTQEAEDKLWDLMREVLEKAEGKWISWGQVEQTLVRQKWGRPELLGINLIKELEKMTFLPSPLLDYKLKNWGTYLVREDLVQKELPTVGRDLTFPDQGNFWIPQWIPYLNQTETKPDTKDLLNYHLRDITWLLSIYRNLTPATTPRE